MVSSYEKPIMRDRILETADRLFYQRGIRAMGVDTIAAAIGISKRTLYNHFPSKDALIAAYLARRSRPAKLTDAPAMEQILATFDALEQRFGSPEFRGCPFVNAVTELGPEEHEVRDVAIAFKEGRRLWFRELLVRLAVGDPDGLATQLAILVDGAITAHLVRGDPAMARAAREAARVLVAKAVAEVAPGGAVPAAAIAEVQPGRVRGWLGYLKGWFGGH
jgi:AcrR family transcriptional regulator